MLRLTHTLLASGLLLSMATQLRLNALPLGPGEACLSLALLLVALQALQARSVPMTAAMWTILVFWMAFIMAQLIGFVTGGLIGDRHDTGLVAHDAATYPMLFAVTWLCAIEPGCQRRLREVAWAMAGLGAVFTLLQLAGAMGLFSLPQVDPWYWDRLRGWTANPNQFALFCLILGFLSLHLVETATSRRQRAVALVCAIIPISVGTLAKTNACNLALVVGFVLFMGIKMSGWLLRRERSLSWRFVGSWMLVIAVPIVLASTVPLVASLSAPDRSKVAAFGRDDSSETGQEAALRLELWRSAVRRGLETGMLGLGPGPHLPIPAILLDARWGSSDEPVNVQHPTVGGAPNFESHNSLLELFLQGGLLAVASFLAIFLKSLIHALRTGRHVLATALCGVLLFGSFHVITRHPAVWFLIVTGLASASPRLAVTNLGRRVRPARFDSLSEGVN